MKFTQTKVLAFIFLNICFLTSQLYAGGASGGGGGHSVKSKNTGQRILYDLLYFDPNFRDVFDFSEASDPVSVAEGILQKWNLFFPSLTAAMYDSIKWRPVEDENPNETRHKSYLLETEPHMKDLFSKPELLAYYPDANNKRDFSMDKVYNVYLIAPRIEKLGFYSQVGLRIHEALRHYQLGSSLTAKYFSDIAIQKATVAYMFCPATIRNYFDIILPVLGNPKIFEALGADYDINKIIDERLNNCRNNPIRYEIEALP